MLTLYPTCSDTWQNSAYSYESTSRKAYKAFKVQFWAVPTGLERSIISWNHGYQTQKLIPYEHVSKPLWNLNFNIPPYKAT